MFSRPRWVGDAVFPGFRIYIYKVDWAGFGGVIMGGSDVFCFGGANCTHCGFVPIARSIRTLEVAYRSAGYEIPDGPIGVRQRRKMENATGTIVTVAASSMMVITVENHTSRSRIHVFCAVSDRNGRRLYRREFEIPPTSMRYWGEYSMSRLRNSGRDAVGYWIVNTPLCLTDIPLAGPVGIFVRIYRRMGELVGR